MDFLSLRREVQQQALTLLQEPDAVLYNGPDDYGVLGPSTGDRRLRVWLNEDGLWKCDADHGGRWKPNQDAPCIHMVVAFVRLGLIEMPNTAASVERKGRDRAAERRAWHRMATRFPEVLKALVEAGAPAIRAAPDPDAKPDPEPEPVRDKGGRPQRLEAILYQAISRVWLRQSMEASAGLLNPWGACSASTLGRFHADPASVRVVEMLLALSTWPARGIERILHPDGTGLSTQHFQAYYDERYRLGKKSGKRESKKAKRRRERLSAVPPNAVLSPADLRRRAREAEREAKRLASALEKPRRHTWAYAEFLWGYRSTLICSLHFQDKPFGEAPWLLPLVERARFMLDVEEVGGDRAYDANYIYHYADKTGIRATVRPRDTGIPHYSDEKKRYRKAAILRALSDPEGHEALWGRRNNAETGNSVFKARLGDEVFTKRRKSGDSTARLVEVYCMAIAWNVSRLVHLEARYGASPDFTGIDFTGGAQRLRERPWWSLDTLAADLRRKYAPRREDAGVREAWKP